MSASYRELALRALAADLLPADLLRETCWTIGRYEVIGVIGQGAAGTVFHVRDPRLDREAALKLMDRAANPDPTRFLQEIRLLAGLKHPGVVAIHDAGLHEGAPYYVMERGVEGTLRRRHQHGHRRRRGDLGLPLGAHSRLSDDLDASGSASAQ